MNPYLAIVTAAVIFGSSGAFIKAAALPVSTMTFFRTALPFVLISLVFVLQKKTFPSLKDRRMVLASFLNAVRLIFFFAGYAFGNISTTVILLYTWPVFATLWSRLFLGERLTLYRLCFFATAFAGLVLVSLNQTLSLGNERFVGMVAILLSAMIYSLTIVIFKATSTRYTPLETLWFQNGFGAVFFLPFFLVNRPVPMLWQAGLAGAYGLLVGILGFGLFFFGLRKVEASRASFLTYIEVVSGIAFGVIFFDEHLSWSVITGGSLILTSALALSRKV